MMTNRPMTFQCPYCGVNYVKYIDAGVVFARIKYRCTGAEEGCGKVMVVEFIEDVTFCSTHGVGHADQTVPQPSSN